MWYYLISSFKIKPNNLKYLQDNADFIVLLDKNEIK